MADTVEFELVTPAKLVLSRPVEMVVVPGGEGDFGVLPGHAPMIATVRPGVVDIHMGGKVTERIFIAGGFAEVSEERCTVLADEAIPLQELNAADARADLEAATKAAEKAADDGARKLAETQIATAEAKIAAAEARGR
ncbi:MAG: ATP synthase F1 subunit epsilon [Hyphomicrobiales bacterium]|nr:ATP synthase F1 subunit epsilon [Hyphomicrobiales bacterium]